MIVKQGVPEDAELLAAFKDENQKEQAFTCILKKYSERLYWHIRRMVICHEDAHDVLQNVSIKVWKGLENFRAEANLYTWLYRIATNESLTFLGNKKNHASFSLSDDQNGLQNLLLAEKNFDARKIEWKLQQAILSLPEKQRLVFNLRYYDEMPYEQMSEITGTSVGALKASYHHALKKVEFIFKEGI